MHNLFEATAAAEITSRLQTLQPTSQPKWGKMTVSQMMAHCQRPFEVFFGELKMKRGLMGILFGKIARKKLFSSKPWPRSLPTARAFLITGEKEFEREKNKLVSLINRFSTEGYTITSSTHPFFGHMSSQEWALFGYRHMDHHLQQFGA
jgi:hypothetical protein